MHIRSTTLATMGSMLLSVIRTRLRSPCAPTSLSIVVCRPLRCAAHRRDKGLPTRVQGEPGVFARAAKPVARVHAKPASRARCVGRFRQRVQHLRTASLSEPWRMAPTRGKQMPGRLRFASLTLPDPQQWPAYLLFVVRCQFTTGRSTPELVGGTSDTLLSQHSQHSQHSP